MKHTRLFAAIAIAVMILAATGTAGTLYVSPDGNASGDGTIANPFDSVMAAYAAACSSADYEMVFLQPGTYVENGTLILSNSLVALRGCGADLTSLRIAIVVTQATSIADMELYSAITNDVVVFLDNVKLNVPPTSPVNIIGVWQWSTNNALRVRGMAAPEQPSDAATKAYVDAATGNLTAASITAGTLAEARIDGTIARDSEIAAATNAMADSFVKKSGDTMSGALGFIGGGSIESDGDGGLTFRNSSQTSLMELRSYGYVWFPGAVMVVGNGSQYYDSVNLYNGAQFGGPLVFTYEYGYGLAGAIEKSPSSQGLQFKDAADNTMTFENGQLTLPEMPVSNLHAATKAYVDAAVTNSAADGRYVKKTGDTMAGTLDMDGWDIANLGMSEDPGSAVTREYVDNIVITSTNIAPYAVSADKLDDTVDNRYVMRESSIEQIVQSDVLVSGTLTVASLEAQGPWQVRDQPVTLSGSNAKITTEGPYDLILAATSNRAVKITQELQLPASQIGSASVSNAEAVVECGICAPSSVVIITPTASIGSGNHYWISTTNGTFSLHQASGSAAWTFNYMVINASN